MMTIFVRPILPLCLILFLLTMPLSAKSGRELKIGIAQEFENLNPLISQMAATSYITGMCLRGLMTLDSQAKYIPVLLKKIPSLKNGLAKIYHEKGKKKIQATYELKDNLKWGDGKPLTGYDVEFTWRVARDDSVSIGEREMWNQIEQIVVNKENPQKMTFIYKKARWDFNQLAGFPVIPKHLEEPIFLKYRKKQGGYEKNSLYATAPTTPGLYNGPFRLKEIRLGSHLSLIPNQHFFGNRPYFSNIIIKVVPNNATLEANLLSNTVDMISHLGLSFDQAVAFEKRVRKQNLPYQVNFRPGLIYEHIDLQLKNSILKDLRVRKALVYGINRDALVNALFEGKQQKAIHNIAPIDPWYSEDPKKIVLYPYSRRKANKLLEKAGWKIGKGGYRYKEGKRLSLQLMTTAGNKVRELVESYLQQQWKKLGVEIIIKNEPPRVFFGDTVRKSRFPAMAMYAWISSPESSSRSTFHSDNIPTKKNEYSGQNAMNWVNKKVDRLLEKIDVTFDPAERKELVKQILYYYTDEVPVIPLYYRSDNSVTPKGMTGYRLTGHQFGPSNHVENWKLPR